MEELKLKQYDFEELNKFINIYFTPSEMCDSLISLAFNYSRCLDEDLVDQFKYDMVVINALISEFRKLKDQE